MSNNNNRVALYVTAAIEASGKPQAEIAREAGYPNANNITMIKQGKSKLNKARVPALAKALGVDEVALMMLVLDQDEPELARWIKRNAQPISRTEANILDIVRRHGGEDLDLSPAQLVNVEDKLKDYLASCK